MLGVKDAGKKAKDNFAKVIREINMNTGRPGKQRVGTKMSRRMPAKLNRHDMINIERGRALFTRPQYLRKEVWIFFDVSGSVAKYVPFVIDLIRTLRRSDQTVHCVCWAERAEEVRYGELVEGNIPEHIGRNTTKGECVAAFIAARHIAEAVIVTDNVAGELKTKISGNVHLCLTPRPQSGGSFRNKRMVPSCTVYDLELDD